MTSLTRLLTRRIADTGPLSLADYTATALTEPQHGYYATRNPLGRLGDFITAPEVSQLFGEIVGLWCAELWSHAPDADHRLVELGPGRGTLAADIARTLGGLSNPIGDLTLDLVEISPALEEVQRRTLRDTTAQWHPRLEDVPPGPAIVIANEFYDALPVRQFVRGPEHWHEQLVTAEEEGGFALTIGPAAPEPPKAPADVLATATPGDIVEDSPARLAHITLLSRRLAAQGGAALILDYGAAEGGLGDSVQAIRAHEHVDPLADPGTADITAHVDFAMLKATAEACGMRAYGPVTQRRFLRTLGIELRAVALHRDASSSQRRGLAAGLDRLIAPDQMGTLFKVLALCHPDWPTPAGFA